MDYQDITLSFSVDERIAELTMCPTRRPCFTLNLLQEIIHAQATIDQHRSDYLILNSSIKDVFNFGGDVKHFRELIIARDREGLMHYMELCIDALEPERTYTSITKLAVVQGSAYGGGFEAALCCDKIIAERQSKFSFPEVKFNLFPGMGAYNYITRKTDLPTADKIIRGGDVFSAEQLYKLGIVDVLCETGEGMTVAQKMISNYEKKKSGYSALRKIEKIISPINRQALLDVGEIWVDYALKISKRDLRLMEAIASNQEKIPR